MVVDSKKCVGCGICVENCPMGAIVISNGHAEIDKTKCINCGACAANCPNQAIKEEE